MSKISKQDKERYIKLMDINHAYPSPLDDEFQNKIYKKREFYYHKIPKRDKLTDYSQIKEYRDNICSRDFQLHDHQSFLANYINPNTPYKGLLVFHGTGTGKTCGAIAICERFKDMVEKYNTKIYVLVNGPLIRENWKNELLKCTKETYTKYQDKNTYIDKEDELKMKKNAINMAYQYYKIITYRSFYKKVLGEKIRERVTKGNKIKTSFRKNEEGEYERDISVDRIYSLDNTLIVVDEAHGLTGNDYGEALKKIIKNSKNLKVVLLTATPMKNLADDIIDILNFIRPPENPIQREKVFTSDKNYMMDFKPSGIDYLRKMSTGYVSYLRGADPLTFAKRIDKGIIPSGLKFTSVTRCKMLDFQLKAYLKAIDSTEDALDKISQSVANFVFPGLSQDKKSIIGYYGIAGINVLKNQLKTHYDSLNNKIGKLLNVDDNDFIYLTDNGRTITGKILNMKYLKFFSIKFYTVIKNLEKLVQNQKGSGPVFIYSNLVKVGIDLFQEILKQNGYLEYEENYSNYRINNDTICYYCGQIYDLHKNDKIKDHEFHPSTFIPITGQSEDVQDIQQEDKQKILNTVFNDINNKEGKLIKFVLGSKVMNEGITLENVKEVHILDVHYNLGRVDQAIGRAIRFCKHYHITNEKNRFPEVNIYKYVVSLDKGLSTEEDLYRKAELKYLLIKKTQRILKENAIDCPLFRHGNIFPEELEKYKKCGTKENPNPCPAVCDYMECDFKCYDNKLNNLYFDKKDGTYKRIEKDNLDYSTFTNDLARHEIDYSKQKIKEMYKTKYSFTLEEIIKHIYDTYSKEKQYLFKNYFVYKALDELIPISENDFNNFKDTILDKFNKPGYIIQRNKYYIFQPFDQNEDVPMYYRANFDKKLLYKLSLYKYMKNTDVYKLYKSSNKNIVKEDDVENDDKDNEDLLNEGIIYDFESVQDYYDSRKEFDFIGIIDKEQVRRKSKRLEEIKDVFKIRERRSKILEKKRGTGIPSLKGAVCGTSKSKQYLIDIGKKIGAKLSKDNNNRKNICKQLKDRLLYLEKYATDKDKNKFTYMMIPKNHPIYKFPYNLEDRVEYIKKEIKTEIKFKIDIKIKTEKDKKTNLPFYTIKINNEKKLKDFTKVFENLDGVLDKKNNEWIIMVD